MGHPLLYNRSDLGGGGDSTAGNGIGWRESLSAVNDLTEVKGVAGCLPGVQNWSIREGAYGAEGIEMMTALGPWLRLSTFPDSFVSHFLSSFDSISRC